MAGVLRRWLGVIRAPFLILVPACLAPAFASVWSRTGELPPVPALLVLVAGVSAHIAVNALNEDADYRSGLDANTVKTPFSGGSGTLVADPGFAPWARRTGVAALAVTALIGLYFCTVIGPALAVPGLVGLALIGLYSDSVNRLPLLCLLAPGLGFGLLMVNLASWVLAGYLPALSVWLSLPTALVVSNLLLVNQLPDLEPDRAAGRRHIAIVWGPATAVKISTGLLAATYSTAVAGWLLGPLPVATLLCLLTLPLAAFVIRRLASWNGDAAALVPAMAANVAITLAVPVLLAVGALL